MALHPIDGGPARRATHPSDPDYVPKCESCGDNALEGVVRLDGTLICLDCAQAEAVGWREDLAMQTHDYIAAAAESAEWVLMVAKTMMPADRETYEPQIRAARLMMELNAALEE